MAISPISLFISGTRRLAMSVDRHAGMRLLHGVTAAFSSFQQERCLDNMRAVFGPRGWTSSDIALLRNRHVDYLADHLYELMTLAASTPSGFASQVDLLGEEHLRDAFREGKGAIVIGSHLGSPMHLRAAIATRSYAVGNVSNRLPIAALEKIFEDIRRNFGIRTTHVGAGAGTSAGSALAENGVFSISFDISTPGRESRSGWHPCGSASILLDHGPARLALRLVSPVLWATIRKLPEGNYLLKLEPLPIDRNDTGEDAASDLTEAWMNKLYGELLERPEEWWHWNNLILRAGTPREDLPLRH